MILRDANYRRTGEIPLQLFDPRQGGVALKLEPISSVRAFSNPQRTNYFTILLIRGGGGKFHLDLDAYDFEGPTLIFCNPYQIFFFEKESGLAGSSLQFHANFFCVETYHEAVGCNGILFNDIYGRPVVPLNKKHEAGFGEILDQMQRELRLSGLAREEMLVSYLKVFLITATRLKIEQQDLHAVNTTQKRHPAIEKLTILIEQHYRTKRTPREFASMLHLSPKALGKLTKAHFGRTLTEVIRERLLKHAKWQLLHTLRPVKEIAGELGFKDELYFSRLFKCTTGLSPRFFREFETAIRGGRNLSMK